MVQSFPARPPKIGFVLCRPVFAYRPISELDHDRSSRQIGGISAFYEKKGG